jgi:hypothetical protein
MLVGQVLEGEFLNCVMAITPSRAYVQSHNHMAISVVPVADPHI